VLPTRVGSVRTAHRIELLLSEAVALLPEEDSADRARLLAMQAAVLAESERSYLAIDGLRSQVHRALATAHRVADRRTELEVAALSAGLETGLPGASARLALARRMREQLNSDDNEVLASYVHAVEREALLRLGRRDDLLAAIAQLRSRASASGAVRAWRHFSLGLPHLVGARLDRCERLLEEVPWHHGDGTLRAAAADRRLRIRWLRGDLEHVGAHLERTRVEEPSLTQHQALRALVLAQRGRTSEAGAAIRAMLVGGGHSLPWHGGRPRVLRDLAEATGLVGDEEAAQVLHPLLEPYDGEILCSYLISADGSAATSLAILETVQGRPDEADAHFAAGHALESMLGAPAPTTSTEVWWAHLRRRTSSGPTPTTDGLVSAARRRARRRGLGVTEATAARLALTLPSTS
jgi:hypothetical protein